MRIRLTNILVDARANIKQQTWMVGPLKEIIFSVCMCVTKKWADHMTWGRPTNLVPWLKTSVWITLKTFWKKKREVQSTLDRCLTSPLAKRQRPATEEEENYGILNKLWKFGRIVKTLCTYFQFNSTMCTIHFQYNIVKIVSFSLYFPFSFIQLGSCLSRPLVSFCPFIVCFLLFYKTYL